MADKVVRPAEMQPPPTTVPAPPPVRRERRLPYGILWIAFLICMFLGAGLIVTGRTLVGIILLALPLVGTMALTAAYYMLQRGGKGE